MPEIPMVLAIGAVLLIALLAALFVRTSRPEKPSSYWRSEGARGARLVMGGYRRRGKP